MAVVAKPFEVGDLVRWTSRGGGVWRHHVGVIVAVVPAGAMPYEHMPPGRWTLHCRDNAPRREASFLIALKSERGRGAGQLYRPRVHHLRRFTEGEPAVVEVRRRSAKGYRPGYDYAVVLHPTHAQRSRGERLANGATFRARRESRDLVVYRPRWSRRDRIIAAVAAPIILGLLALLVIGMQGVVPA